MPTISNEDIDALIDLGHDTLKNIVALVVEAILYTVYFVLVVIAGRILVTSKTRTNMSIVTFLVVVVMLMLDTTLSVMDVNNAIREITSTLTSSSAATFKERYDNVALTWPIDNALYAWMSNLGDLVVVWRAYAFYREPRERWILLFPVSLLVGSVATSILVTFCTAKFEVNPTIGDLTAPPPFCINGLLASYIMALATTALATGMICWKTWVYRRTIGSSIRSKNRRTRVEKIMMILIESGILYFLFFLSVVIDDAGEVPTLETSTPSLAFASTIVTYMTSHILGIYPVLVVILVHSRKSYIEHATASSSVGLPSHPSHSSHSHSTWSSHTYWGSPGSRSKPAIDHVGRSHVLVHELREVHCDTSPSVGDMEGGGELHKQDAHDQTAVAMDAKVNLLEVSSV